MLRNDRCGELTPIFARCRLWPAGEVTHLFRKGEFLWLSQKIRPHIFPSATLP